MWQLLVKLALTLAGVVICVPMVTSVLFPHMLDALAPNPLTVIGGDTSGDLLESVMKDVPSDRWAEVVSRMNSRTGESTSLKLVDIETVKQRSRATKAEMTTFMTTRVMERRLASEDRRWTYARYLIGRELYVLLADERTVVQATEFPPTHRAETMVALDAAMWTSRILVIALAVTIWLVPMWRMLRRLNAAAAEFGRGNFAYRVHMSSLASLYPIAKAFNLMADRIAKLVASHQELTRSVAHDLRTPLNRLRLARQLLMEAGDSAGRVRLLQSMAGDINELEQIVDGVLTHGRLERGNIVINRCRINAIEWIEACVERAEVQAQVKGFNLQMDIDCRVAVLWGDPFLLDRCLSNLLHNAIRFARTEIRITLELTGGFYLLVVEDDGVGIQEQDRSRVFDPYVRLPRDDERHAGGLGLGLSIVHQVAQLHGGAVSVESSMMGGAKFVLSLPVEVVSF
jgi:signal transduction histidine kinase